MSMSVSLVEAERLLDELAQVFQDLSETDAALISLRFSEMVQAAHNPRPKPPPKKSGRPLLYAPIIRYLVDHEIYSAATALERYSQKYPFEGKARTRARIALIRFTANHHFPKFGDGFVSHPLPKSQPTRGWYGWRWNLPLVD